MTNIEALKALLVKVEAGDHRVGMWGAFKSEIHPHAPDYARQSFLGSLDAAKALHEAVLPGWTYCDLLRRGNRYTVHINKGIDETCRDFSAVSESPARAWLIAILKALIAEGESK